MLEHPPHKCNVSRSSSAKKLNRLTNNTNSEKMVPIPAEGKIGKW